MATTRASTYLVPLGDRCLEHRRIQVDAVDPVKRLLRDFRKRLLR